MARLSKFPKAEEQNVNERWATALEVSPPDGGINPETIHLNEYFVEFPLQGDMLKSRDGHEKEKYKIVNLSE